MIRFTEPVKRAALASSILVALAIAVRVARDTGDHWAIYAWGIGASLALLLNWERTRGH